MTCNIGNYLIKRQSERHLIMGITTTLKVNVNQLAYKYTYTYSKVLITACSTSVVITAITKYLEKKVNIQTFIWKCEMVPYYLRNMLQNGSKTTRNIQSRVRSNKFYNLVATTNYQDSCVK